MSPGFEVVAAASRLPSPGSGLEGRRRGKSQRCPLWGVFRVTWAPNLLAQPSAHLGLFDQFSGGRWLRGGSCFSVGWGWRKRLQHSEVIQGSHPLGYTPFQIWRAEEVRRSPQLPWRCSVALTLWRFPTACPLIREGTGGEGVGGGGER